MPAKTWTRRALALTVPAFMAAVLLPLLGAPIRADEIVVYTRGGKIRFDEDVGRDLKEAILVTYDTDAKGPVKKETLEVYKHLSKDQEIITPGQITETCQKVFVIQKVGDLFFFRGLRKAEPPAAGGATPSTPSTPTPAAGAVGGAAKAGSTAPKAGSTAPKAGSTAPKAGSTTPKAGSTAPKAGSTAPKAGSTTPKTGSTAPKAGASTVAAGTAPKAGTEPKAGTRPKAGTEPKTGTAAGAAPAAAPPEAATTPKAAASGAFTAATLSPETEEVRRPLTDEEVVRSVRDKVRRVTREIVAIDARQKGSAKLRASIINREFTASLGGFDEEQMKRVVSFVHEEELNPNREYYVLRSFGWAFHSEKQYDKAVYFYDGCIALIPENYSAFLQKGYALDKAGRAEESLEAYVTALCMRPRRAVRYLAALLRRTHTTPKLSRADLNAIREAFGPVVRGLQNRDTQEAKARAEELSALVQRLLSPGGGSAPAPPPPLPEDFETPIGTPAPTPTPASTPGSATTTDGGTH